MNCETFQSGWDRYLASAMDGPERSAFEDHASACGQCREALEAWQAWGPAMQKDAERLSEGPSPYFFATQFYEIRDRIEAENRGWWYRLLPWWKPVFSKPVTAVALFVMLTMSWTLFRTGTVPFAGNDSDAKAVEAALLSDDSLFLIFDMLISEEGDTLTFLF